MQNIIQDKDIELFRNRMNKGLRNDDKTRLIFNNELDNLKNKSSSDINSFLSGAIAFLVGVGIYEYQNVINWLIGG